MLIGAASLLGHWLWILNLPSVNEKEFHSLLEKLLSWPTIVLLIVSLVIFRHREALDYMLRNFRLKVGDSEYGPPQKTIESLSQPEDPLHLSPAQEQALKVFSGGETSHKHFNDIKFLHSQLTPRTQMLLAELAAFGDQVRAQRHSARQGLTQPKLRLLCVS